MFLVILIAFAYAYGLFLSGCGFTLKSWEYWVFILFQAGFIFLGANI